ncbi:MAG: MBL fold metallo-hydrolase [Clostridia bacterium]|nr:MBL fold metallo-hydrolase [Clostridia bacterium]
MKENKVIEIKYYACGYCTNKLKYIIKKPQEKIKKFYAGVFLIKHSKYGYVLFDTGYSEQIYKCGIKGKIYNIFNPTYITKNEKITEQLRKENINPELIKTVILSHLHPDHIGCAKEFENAEFIVSKDCQEEYKRNKLKSLIFKNMLPVNFEDRTKVICDFHEKYELLNRV